MSSAGSALPTSWRPLFWPSSPQTWIPPSCCCLLWVLFPLAERKLSILASGQTLTTVPCHTTNLALCKPPGVPPEALGPPFRSPATAQKSASSVGFRSLVPEQPMPTLGWGTGGSLHSASGVAPEVEGGSHTAAHEAIQAKSASLEQRPMPPSQYIEGTFLNGFSI